MTLSPDTLRPDTLTELEASLHQMKTANYFLRVAVDQVPEAVLILEAETNEKSGPKVLFSNATAAVLVGVEPEKGLRGMGITDLAAGDMDAAVLLESLNRAVENGGAHECEAMVQNFYGNAPQRCRWRVRAVFNSLRKLLNFTLIVTPLTAGQAAGTRATPMRCDDLDAQSNQLKQDNLAALAQGIAHDVNNLLGPVTMRLSDLLQQVQGQPALKEELQLIFSGLKRARQFTSQVVTACKSKPHQKQPVDLAAIIHDTVKFAGAGSNAQLRVRLGTALRWPVADGVKISQVLQNLILNGIQSMPQGGYMDVDAENADIGLAEDEVLKPGTYVRVTVRDRGCGIPPENLDRLFKETFTTKPDGNGIGLTTCKLFIHDLDGDIRVSSRLNVGTEFTIYLPAVPALIAGATAEKDQAPVPLKKGQGRVLIVDDEDDLRKVAHLILKRCGYEVIECDNGQDAVKIYHSLARTGTPPDVVLMDLTLRGGMNGGETAAEILRFDPEARLVVTSGSVNEDVQMTYLEKGFVGVLPKPYEAGELTQIVHRVVTMMSRA
ncbi:response regulator receiver domain-containing protein [Prosthecobacter fusiformis]|uniref:histidine kinase n=1 Tax=Prosthecobacter fusiformis TaxID=48464 RepID=A0A4R7SR90_9BACT|nr:ATP-binding protein [Prosthecobacter fusiformis]TDU81631.1 response regulator receiver domain-containing protein [Prosthecobacter fusiformis]